MWGAALEPLTGDGMENVETFVTCYQTLDAVVVVIRVCLCFISPLHLLLHLLHRLLLVERLRSTTELISGFSSLLLHPQQPDFAARLIDYQPGAMRGRLLMACLAACLVSAARSSDTAKKMATEVS